MLRNSERQTGHQAAKKNKNTGRPWLDSSAVDLIDPSNSVNSKWGRVLPTSAPKGGCSTIKAALAGAAAGTGLDPSVELGGEVDSWTAVISEAGTGVAAIGDGPGAGASPETGLGSDAAVACRVAAVEFSATVSDEGAATSEEVGCETMGASVADVPQASMLKMTAVSGNASTLNIRNLSRSTNDFTEFVRVRLYYDLRSGRRFIVTVRPLAHYPAFLV